MTRFEFEVLTYLEKQPEKNSSRDLSNVLRIADSAVLEAIPSLLQKEWVKEEEGILSITSKGLEALEPYRVKKAIIMAAGFGSRMVPVTLDMPKPLVPVNGVRLIDTMLDGLYQAGVEEIVLVRGYKKEMFEVLKEKYPNLIFRDNDEYEVTNNISSIMKGIDWLDQCYICEADFYISNPNIFTKYVYHSYYFGTHVIQTDDWCFDVSEGKMTNYRKGGWDCFHGFGISCWNHEDSKTLREDLTNTYEVNKDVFWEQVPLQLCTDHYSVEARPCKKEDIVEIDQFSELVELDPSYEHYGGKDESL